AELIRFSVPHGFEDGDIVVYEAGGEAPVTSPGTDHGRFQVKVIGEDAIQLLRVGQRDQIEVDPSIPGIIDSVTDTVRSLDHHFIDGDAVTYHAPRTAFSSTLVDVGV